MNPPTPPTPGWRGRAGASGWGSAELGAASGVAGQEAGSSFACCAFPALGSPPLSPAGGSRSGRASPSPPPARPRPRSPSARSLGATSLRLSHFSRRFAWERVNIPLLGFQLASNLRRRPACLPAREAQLPPPLRAAISPPSLPPGPPDRRHTHLKLVLRVCGINFPEATSPPEEVDRQLCIYMWVSLQVDLEQDGLVCKEADFGGGNFLLFRSGLALLHEHRRTPGQTD